MRQRGHRIEEEESDFMFWAGGGPRSPSGVFRRRRWAGRPPFRVCWWSVSPGGKSLGLRGELRSGETQAGPAQEQPEPKRG